MSDAQPDTPDVYEGRTPDTESGRRQTAADLVTVLFDDDFDDSSDVRNFGAGPQINLTGGIPLQDGFSASQLITLPAETSYKPDLALNAGNDQDGDIVTGIDSVTVRMRRDATGVTPGVNSNGGPVPYLFGRGSLASPATKAAGMQFDVRSVAATLPVVRIGVQQSAGGQSIPGGIPFGIMRDTWQLLPENTATSFPLEGTDVGSTATVIRSIGAEISVLPVAQTADGYCAIFDDVAGISRVIGFGWVQIAPDPGDPANVLITKHRDGTAAETVAAENATPRLSEAWDTLQTLSEDDRSAVITANRNFADPLVSPVLSAGE